jgi:hypothetical protein
VTYGAGRIWSALVAWVNAAATDRIFSLPRYSVILSFDKWQIIVRLYKSLFALTKCVSRSNRQSKYKNIFHKTEKSEICIDVWF